jgi:peptide/nickel transport system permease protein
VNKEEIKRALRKIVKNPTAMLGFVLLIIFIIVAILAPIIAPPDYPIESNLKEVEDALDDFDLSKKTDILFYFNNYLNSEYQFIMMDYPDLMELKDTLTKYEKNEVSFDELYFLTSELASYYIIDRYYLNRLTENVNSALKELKREISRQENIYKEAIRIKTEIEKLENTSDNNFKKQAETLHKNIYKSYIKKINYDPYIMRKVTNRNEPQPPSSEYKFGVSGGRDIFYGVIWGTRTGFKIGLIVVLISSSVGIFLGSIAAYFGGIVDEIIMRITDIFLSIPFFLGAMVITTILGTGLDKVMISMTVLGWMITARLIRGNILQTKNEQYVLAAKAIGVSDWKIIIMHILPNTIFPVIIQASMRIGGLVITAAALSFLGLGSPQGYADWGSILSYSRDWMSPENWYIIVIPGVAMILFVLAWNLVGDSLRDIFDPKMRM